MHGCEELCEEWDKEDTTNDGIIEIKLGKSQSQRRISCQEKPNWIHWFVLLFLFSVKHDMTSCNNACGHLKECPNGMETCEIPNQRHQDLAIHGVLMVAVEASCLGVTDLLQQRDSPQSCKQFLQAVLRQIGHVWQDQSRHGKVREGQGRQEPGGLIPDLSFLGEPGLQHAEIQEGPESDHVPRSLEVPLHPNEHRRKDR